MYNFTDNYRYAVFSCKKKGIHCQFIAYSGFEDPAYTSENYHFHSLYEAHIPISESLHILAEDIDMIVNPGEVCIIPPGKIHHIINYNCPRTGFRFKLSPTENLFSKVFDRLDSVTIIKNCNIYDKYIRIAMENYKANMPSLFIADFFFHSLYEIYLILNGNADKEKTDASELVDILISQSIEDFINGNYTQKIQLEDLAKHLNLGKRQTQRVTEKYFGTTFSHLLSKKRLETAKFLLKTTDMSIDDISIECGYEDKNYFYRKFSAAFNTTPGKYRNEIKNKHKT